MIKRWWMTIGITCGLLAAGASVRADSYLVTPNTGERLYQWDGEYLMKPNTGERLYTWDGTYIMVPNTRQRLFKFDGTYLTKPNTGERLMQVNGPVAIAILIALATGLL